MMNHPTQETGKLRKDHIKLTLIPVLVLILAALVFWPDSTSEKNTEVPQLRATPVKAVAADRHESGTAHLDHQWPAVDLSQITAINPFAKSIPIKEMLGELSEGEPAADVAAPVTKGNEPTVTAEPVEQKEEPSPLPAEPPETPEREIIDVATIATLQAIIENDRGRSALINSRIVRVGDLLNDEYQIVEISPTAVFVEWIEPKETEPKENGESI